MENGLANYRPSTSLQLSDALISLRVAVRDAAQQNVNAVVDQEGGFTETEREAMLVVEELKQVNGLELAAVLMRGELIHTIRERNLLANHPGGFHTLAEMARDQGISITELDTTIDMVDIIFPYVQNNLGIPVAQLWEQIGRSNLKELLPLLKSIITGEPSVRASVNGAVERILDDVAATAQTAGQTLEDADLRRTAVDVLLHDGAHLTNRELRNHIRPDRTPAITASVLQSNGNRMVITEMTEDQWTMFNRKLGGSIDYQQVDLPENPRQRQVEAARIPGIRSLLRYLEGE